MNKKRLVLDVKPGQLVSYGKLLVGFHDKEKKYKDPEGKEIINEELYIYVQIADDKYTIVNRKAGFIKIKDDLGDLIARDEKELYKRAYEKYLDIKESREVDHESLLKEAQKRIAELESATSSKVDGNGVVPTLVKKNNRFVKKEEIKDEAAELDKLPEEGE
jgi:hypothetical protein